MCIYFVVVRPPFRSIIYIFLPGGSWSDPNGLLRPGIQPFTRILEYKTTLMERFARMGAKPTMR